MLSSSALTAAPCGLQPLLKEVAPKRLLLHGPRFDSVAPVAAPASHKRNSFNAHVIMILAVVLCALIGAVVMSVVVRCALSVSRCVWPEVPREPGPCLPADYAAAARVKGEAVAAASGVIVYSSEQCGGGS
ncbi:RING-H2 finger protein ATL78-like [Musa acuminata AAA Group]|uniref:RING-H2 finger protein ATL78-like n=1 Tax=Musa acuminata AAA Group TaxID=214697 RepID=UPI0031E10146